MKGSVYSVGPNSWRISISLGKDADGKYKRHTKVIHNCRKKSDAERIMREIMEDLERKQNEAPKQPFADYIRLWLELREPDLEKNTWELYERVIEAHLIPSLGEFCLDEITPEVLENLYVDKRKDGRLQGEGPLSHRTIHLMHTILNQAFKHAVNTGRMSSNPSDVVKPKKKKTASDTMSVLSKEQLFSFLAACVGHRDYALIYVAAYSGARQSELLGLTWSHVNWQENTITIAQSLHRLNQEYELRPRLKNKTSKRTVDLTDDVMNVLKEHRKTQMAKGKNDKNLVFTDLNGEPEDRKNLYHRFKNLAAKLGYPDMTFHDLRHTHATILLTDGVYPREVQERLGHADIQTTLSIYGHCLPKRGKTVAERFKLLVMENSKQLDREISSE